MSAGSTVAGAAGGGAGTGAGECAYTLTFGDRAEHHPGMPRSGQLAAAGLSVAELSAAAERLRARLVGVEAVEDAERAVTVVRLDEALPAEVRERAGADAEAAVLLIRASALSALVDWKTSATTAADSLGDALLEEQQALEYDKVSRVGGRVVPKRARWNLVFAPEDESGGGGAAAAEAEADDDSRGTVVPFSKVPIFEAVRSSLVSLLGTSKVGDLVAEANHYYDVSRCGIGYHGDGERRITIGIRLGANIPLRYVWVNGGEGGAAHQVPDSRAVDVTDLESGDMYVMSEKATGFDFRDGGLHLRHAAGAERFLVWTDKPGRKKK